MTADRADRRAAGHRPARRAAQRGVPGDDADARLGRRRGAGARRGPGDQSRSRSSWRQIPTTSQRPTTRRPRSRPRVARPSRSSTPRSRLRSGRRSRRPGSRRTRTRTTTTRGTGPAARPDDGRGGPGVRRARGAGRGIRPPALPACAASRSIRRATSARGATATTSTNCPMRWLSRLDDAGRVAGCAPRSRTWGCARSGARRRLPSPAQPRRTQSGPRRD